MLDYYYQTKKYALTLGLTPGFLWLIGGVLGVYYSKGSTSYLVSALVTGGIPIITTVIASRFNIVGPILLILEALALIFLVYSNGNNLVITIVLFLSYSLPLILSAIMFFRYWYKNKTRI